MSLLDSITGAAGFGLTGTTWVRLRGIPVKDEYSGDTTAVDWTEPDMLRFRGALSSSSSTRTPDSLRDQTTSTAYLTVPDPTVDVKPGDRIRADPDDGRRWEVTGYPARDVNGFTGWQPTCEIPLTEWRG